MVEYAYHPRCRRQMVLDYFGDEDWRDRGKRCGACDNCDAVANGRTTGPSESELEAIKKLLSLVGALHGRFGRTKVASIANATDDDDRFGELPERGCLRGWPQKHVLDLLRSLEGAGLVEASRGEYPTILTTKRGDLVAIGRIDAVDLGIQMPTVTKRARKKR
jgi:ATP-dependent DNA helicase RecQ